MIQLIDIQEQQIAARIQEIQLASYQIEAELIDFTDLPPLRETIQDLIACGEIFYSYVDEGTIVGAISYTIEADQLQICRMMVHPAYFRRGIADQLLAHLMDKYPEIMKIVTTGALNAPAIRLYQKHGFKLVREIEVEPGLSLAWLEA
ncbi:GNAT family N-acetyltransferase [Paenibacillus albiflavus]|nr:GNAT family N-acetyltransferase [Paenibacillus albiflavus]